MIPFWYLPYALACGNTGIVKPSERCPMTMQKVFRLLEQVGFPKGVVNLVNGGADTVNALLDHPAIAAVTFVGSTPVARHIYSRASANGKRVQAQGGAKNPIIILPDADMAADDQHRRRQRLRQRRPALPGRFAGDHSRRAPTRSSCRRWPKPPPAAWWATGWMQGVQMGPVITPQSKARIEGLIQKGLDEGAELVVDGRDADDPGLRAAATSCARPS